MVLVFDDGLEKLTKIWYNLSMGRLTKSAILIMLITIGVIVLPFHSCAATRGLKGGGKSASDIVYENKMRKLKANVLRLLKSKI